MCHESSTWQAGRDYAMIRPSLSLAFPQGRCNQGTQVHLTNPPPPPGGKRRPAPLPPCLPADWAGSDWLPRTTPSPRAAVMEIMGIRPSPAAGTRCAEAGQHYATRLSTDLYFHALHTYY